MRGASLAEVSSEIAQMQLLYGKFDLDRCGEPTQWWVGRNIAAWKPPEFFEHAFFPDVYLSRVHVNRRLVGPLGHIYGEIVARWTAEARRAYGLNQFVKCYSFGSGDVPTLFWYGAAWRLSPQVGGETLSEVIKIFIRHGFTHCGVSDKRRLRDFELW